MPHMCRAARTPEQRAEAAAAHAARQRKRRQVLEHFTAFTCMHVGIAVAHARCACMLVLQLHMPEWCPCNLAWRLQRCRAPQTKVCCHTITQMTLAAYCLARSQDVVQSGLHWHACRAAQTAEQRAQAAAADAARQRLRRCGAPAQPFPPDAV